MNDHDQALLDSFLAGDIQERVMPGFLPDPRLRCTALWYATAAGLLTGNWPADLDFLACLGLRAERLARAHRVPYWTVPEGPYMVHMQPEWVFDLALQQMREDAARLGQEPGPGYWEAGDYG